MIKYTRRLFLAKSTGLVIVPYLLKGTPAASQPEVEKALPLNGYWKAGLAKTVITPESSLWMAGFAARNKPSSGVLHNIWAKALVLEDEDGNKSVIVTTDLLGFPKKVSDRIRVAIYRKFGFSKEHIILSSSHTHSGPVLRDALVDIYPFGEDEKERIAAYSGWLEDAVLTLVREAVSHSEAVRMQTGTGITRFQVNRRNNKEAEADKFIDFNGPNEYSVPVIKLINAKGDLRCLLFSYACHPTTLSGYEWSGDYVGFAQLALEEAYPGTMAMFCQGAGADQNPLPRHSIPLARQYGQELALAVRRVIEEDNLTELTPKIRTSYIEIELPLSAPPSKEELLAILQKPGDTDYIKRWAKRNLERLQKGEILERSYPYPIVVWKLDNRLLFALGGEVVITYAIRLKEIYGWDTIVLGYCNDVMAYIPTVTILKEGGYEGDTSQKVYGLPSKWDPAIEELILNTCKNQVEKLTRI